MTPETAPASPPPTFDVLPLSAELRHAVDDLGYVHPTPVQRAVFELASRGRDLVVQARTGTGKTAAFGLPLIDGVVRRKEARVQALALCPTRELALQVTREITALSKYRGTRVVAVYGGAPMPKQIEQIRDGAQILVGTPGRVLDHLSRGTLDASAIRAVVLDESDEMLSMGFLPQINEIFSYLPETRQTLLFSATLPSDIRRMAENKLTNPEFITLSGDHIGALEIRHFVYLSRGDKLSELVQVLENENPESAVIFCNTRDETKRVAAAISQQGFTAEWLNADLAQNERERVMEATRQSKLRFLVATDVAARGIDISHLTHVINFDFPDSAESYVHRTGRTGRAGRTGTAISLIEPSDIGNLYLLRLTYKLKPIERQLPSATELRTRAETDLVRWFVDGLGKREIHADDLALARRLLSHEQAEVVVAGLLRDHLGARPDAQDDATAARRAGAPKPAPAAVVTPGPVPGAKPARSAEATPTAPTAPARPRRIPETRTAEAPAPEAVTASAPVAPRAPVDRAVAAPAPVAAPPPIEAVTAPAPSPVRVRSPQSGDALDVKPTARVRERRVTRRVEAPSRPDVDERDDMAGTSPGEDPDSQELADDTVELYASVGRRHGAKPSDYERLLEARGVPVDAIAYVRVRHRNAFVAVRRTELDRVLEALEGASVAGRIVRVEPSRGSGPRGPEDIESDEAV